MAESLEDFLKPKPSKALIGASGNMRCFECDEPVYSGSIDEDAMILIYNCTKGHESRIKM